MSPLYHPKQDKILNFEVTILERVYLPASGGNVGDHIDFPVEKFVTKNLKIQCHYLTN